jgi:formylglycine-generating enzyme required for sulfatase activity
MLLMNEERRPAEPIPPRPIELHFDIEAGDFGCVLELPSKAEGETANFLSTMNTLTKRSLFSYDAEWKFLKQTMIDIPRTKSQAELPSGMVRIPKPPNGTFAFHVQGIEIEGSDEYGVDVQFPWESQPHKNHQQHVEIEEFFIDKYPVTQSQYAKYLAETKFRPEDAYNWLKNWAHPEGNNTPVPSPELANVPVTYVSLAEARAYCRWSHGGARLPHAWEYQYAAVGTDGRVWPWGENLNQSNFPVKKNGNIYTGPENVTAHEPHGDSPLHVSDMFGNVWHYTDEFQDDHTRAVLLYGGSNYYPVGSNWYFPNANDMTQHGKYFLFDDRYERAGTIGFRCVVDVAATLYV